MSDREVPGVVGGQQFPRPMTEAEQRDALVVINSLRGNIHGPAMATFQWSTGPFWPSLFRRQADHMEKAIPALRRMADWLDARQPKPEGGSHE